MERYKIIVSDHERRIYEETPYRLASYMIASLAADPTNLSELEIAFGRFGPGMDFSWFSDQVRMKGETESFLMIDLPSKTIRASSDFKRAFPRGEVTYKIPKDDSEVPIRYWISDEWTFIESENIFEADQKRRELRTSIPPQCSRTDYRKVLYGRELSEFLVSKVTGDSISIHKAWLTEKREDLDGRSPRDILLEHQDRVDFDLYSRELQWSFVGTCPPLIPMESEAFQYAAFGTHEFVIYYDMIRHMLKNFTEDVEEMESIKAKWLESPNDDGPLRIPAEIIESERRRLPLEATAAEMMIDEDCPICQMMMSEFDTPTFMHLDSAHFHEDYIFSNYRTEDEWLKNRQEWEEFNKKFEMEQTSLGNDYC